MEVNKETAGLYRIDRTDEEQRRVSTLTAESTIALFGSHRQRAGTTAAGPSATFEAARGGGDVSISDPADARASAVLSSTPTPD